MSMETNNIKETIVGRRSIRQLKKNETITKEKVENILKVTRNAPSAFNMQSSRLVVLMDTEHEKFWNIVKETLRPLVPTENFSATEERLQGFRNGNGTILFFENQETIETMQENAPSYAEHFPNWSHQGNAILQYAIWLAFKSEDIAASLQHYNPIVDEAVQKEWNIPSNWKLIAQMPFGEANETPAEKTFLPFEEIVTFK